MKKLFFCLVMALMAVCANAQVTWNVRAGVGVQEFEGDYEKDSHGGWTVAVESNIPFKTGSSFTFSPSLSFFMGIGEGSENMRITLPLHLGYKIFLSDNLIFFPKVGPAIAAGNYFEYGPSLELPFEYKRLVITLQAQELISENHNYLGAALTLGYKF